MKKKMLVAVMLIAAIAANAQNDYKVSLGATVGTLYGASYKGFIFGVDGLALAADLGVNLFAPAMEGGSFGAYTFELNPNVEYQGAITSFSAGNLSWFAGGGVSLGLMSPLEYNNVVGKFGVNAVGGVELGLNSVPLALSFDFRPGYGLQFNKYGSGSFFDWKLVLSVRYIF